MKMILASNSPRRRELLGMLGIPFEILVSEVEESVFCVDPVEVTLELSRRKAEAVSKKVEKGVVIGTDTVVALRGEILGKPRDREEARKMILSLQGREHEVYTGVTVLVKSDEKEEVHSFCENTRVKVAPMTEEEMESYISTEEPYDKAGGYGIQGIFGKYIEGIEGDYYNVVGFPVHRFYEVLKKIDSL